MGADMIVFIPTMFALILLLCVMLTGGKER